MKLDVSERTILFNLKKKLKTKQTKLENDYKENQTQLKIIEDELEEYKIEDETEEEEEIDEKEFEEDDE